VKLDIEGYEYRALLGAQRLLAMRPTMFVEVHPIERRRNGSSARAVVELLSANYPNVTLYQQHQHPTSSARCSVPMVLIVSARPTGKPFWTNAMPGRWSYRFGPSLLRGK
jgi:Methyltransferase FkbM domain